MTSDSSTDQAGPAPARDVATVVETRETGCTVRFLGGGGSAEARWADDLRRRGVAVRPGHLVVVAAREDVAASAPVPYEVVWRGPAVATVLALDGDQLTYTTGSPTGQTATGTLRDARPLEERRPIRVGQQVVVAPTVDDPDAVALLDVAADGLPLHPARLRAAVLARAARPPAVGAAGADPRRIVAEGYDRMAERYAAWATAGGGVVDGARARYEARLLDRLPAGVRVLELGCGGGGPTTRALAERFVLTGVDLSARQIELARANVPGATFIHGDMTRVAFPPGDFDAVAAFYAFLHLPHGELPGLLRKIAAWLRPGGVLVATLATEIDRGTVEPDWLGVPMYFSGESPEDTQRALVAAGLRIEDFREQTIFEEGRPVVFRWVVAHLTGEALA